MVGERATLAAQRALPSFWVTCLINQPTQRTHLEHRQLGGLRQRKGDGQLDQRGFRHGGGQRDEVVLWWGVDGWQELTSGGCDD